MPACSLLTASGLQLQHLWKPLREGKVVYWAQCNHWGVHSDSDTMKSELLVFTSLSAVVTNCIELNSEVINTASVRIKTRLYLLKPVGLLTVGNADSEDGWISILSIKICSWNTSVSITWGCPANGQPWMLCCCWPSGQERDRNVLRVHPAALPSPFVPNENTHAVPTFLLPPETVLTRRDKGYYQQLQNIVIGPGMHYDPHSFNL